jgi:hypothetical protein
MRLLDPHLGAFEAEPLDIPTMPTARTTRSASTVAVLPAASIVAVTELPLRFSPFTVAPVWIAMPCFSKALRAKAEISSSSAGTTRSSTSITVTSAPMLR